MGCQINVVYNKSKDELIAKAKEAVEKINGKFEGNESSGFAEADSPFGRFKASYTINGDQVNIDIQEKPFLISCKKIREMVDKYIKEHSGEEVKSS